MKLPKFLGTFEGKLVSFIVLIVVILFAYYFYATSNVNKTPVNIEVNATDHVRGNMASNITLVEFGDFQCPACGAWETVVEDVVKKYENDIKFVFKNYPLTQIHKNALLAAKSAEAAGLQGKYWEMHDLIYSKQDEWSESNTAKDLFISYAENIGLNINTFKNDLNNPSIEQNILGEYTEGTNLGVLGTPTFFLNGQILDNMKSFSDLDDIIQAEIKKQVNK
jgi:protein-disulfide isomerase